MKRFYLKRLLLWFFLAGAFAFGITACVNNYSLPPLSASAAPTPTATSSIVVITYAGSGAASSINANGTAASFDYPYGITIDSSGNLYVADQITSLIRKIAPGAVVTTLAGTITGTFDQPRGVAVDSSSNVYVADTIDDMIREVTPGGVVSTLAGSGFPGSTNGTGTAASFDYPYGVAVDSSDNVYVADTNNHLIRKITSGAVVSTLAGSGSPGYANGIGTGASFDYPQGVAVDSSGNVYVADTINCAIRKITSGGVVTTLAGTGSTGSSNGTGTAASFYYPTGVAVDSSGNVYVADGGNNLIRKITPGGVVSTLAGSGIPGIQNGPAATASFNDPKGVAVDSSGNVYVTDANTNLIREIY